MKKLIYGRSKGRGRCQFGARCLDIADNHNLLEISCPHFEAFNLREACLQTEIRAAYPRRVGAPY